MNLTDELVERISQIENGMYINLLKNSNATFKGNVKLGDITCLALENSKASFNGIIELGCANIIAGDNSTIKFWNIDANYAKIVASKGAIVDLNGNIDTVEMKMHKEADIKDNFTWTYQTAFRIDSSYFSNVSKKFKRINEDGTIITSNEDSVYLTDEYRTNVNAIKNTAGAFAKMKDEQKLKYLGDKGGKFIPNFSYGILGWSNRVSSVDDLFSSPSGPYSLKSGSSWNLGFRYQLKLNKRWTISTGLGYESNIFRFDNNVKLTDINGKKRIDFETSHLINAESKLVARYVTIPLFIKYRIVKKFSVHVGAIAGVNFRTSSTGFKRDYKEQNNEVEERWGTQYDNFKPLKLEVQAGFGLGYTNFYVKYAVTQLFKDNREIEVYPYSVGVSFGL